MTTISLPRAAARRPFWRAPFAAQSYRELGFVLTSLPVAVAGFCFTVTFFSVGVGLLVTALGLPVLALLLLGSRGFGALERHRGRALLGLEVGSPGPVRPTRPGFWGTVTARLGDATGWKAVLYQLLMFPWAVFSFALSLVLLAYGWAAFLYPAYHWVFARYVGWPGLRMFNWTDAQGVQHDWYIQSPWQIAGLSATGLLLIYLAHAVVRGLTNVDRIAIRGLLGSR